MKGTLILAEAASNHPDGTISILRGGITRIWGDKTPVSLKGTLVFRIENDLTDAGDHVFEILCIDADGVDAMPRLRGNFKAPAGEETHSNLIMDFMTGFEKMGLHVFVAKIDKHEVDRWKIVVGPRPKKETAT